MSRSVLILTQFANTIIKASLIHEIYEQISIKLKYYFIMEYINRYAWFYMSNIKYWLQL